MLSQLKNSPLRSVHNTNISIPQLSVYQYERSSHEQHNNKNHNDDYTQHHCPPSRLNAQFIHTTLFRWTPVGFSTIGTKREKFIWRTQTSLLYSFTLPIHVRTNGITNLLTFKDCVAMRTTQQQILCPIGSHTGRTSTRRGCHLTTTRNRFPVSMT